MEKEDEEEEDEEEEDEEEEDEGEEEAVLLKRNDGAAESHNFALVR